MPAAKGAEALFQILLNSLSVSQMVSLGEIDVDFGQYSRFFFFGPFIPNIRKPSASGTAVPAISF
jgi:hypothetical protein